jgi:hypothetical protein
VPDARLLIAFTALPDADHVRLGNDLRRFVPLVRTVLAGIETAAPFVHPGARF